MRLGNILDTAGLNKPTIMEAVKLGLGAGAFPFVYGFLQTQLLKASPMFAQGTATEFAARAVAGLALGTITSRQFNQRSLGDGMMASAVGSVFRDLLARYTNPAAAAIQANVKAAEMTTGEAQSTATNATATGIEGLAGFAGRNFGNVGNTNDTLLYGVGTPNMQAAGMFGAATVAVEQSGFSGATLAIEQPGFAGALM
jgi:hypothetical protein